MPLPPDRAPLLTEQRNTRSMDLHALSVRGCVDLFNSENRAVFDAMDRAAPALASLIEDLVPRFEQGGRLVYVGAGTSGRLGVLDASECPPTFQLPEGRVVGIIAGGDASLRRSSEGKEDDPRGAEPELRSLELRENDSVLGIAAGATTPYVLGALGLAKSARTMRASTGDAPLTALLVCSPIARPPGVDHLIILETGPEILTGSTRLKAGTATKLALNTITTTLMVRTGRVYQNLMVDLRTTNDKLRDRAARIVSTLTALPRDEAFALLERAGGAVKTAVVMHSRGIGRDEAEELLGAAGASLDRVVRGG